MKFSQIKNNNLKRCKNYIWNNGYFVGFTGKRVLLFDNNFDVLTSCEKLFYAYKGELSPQNDKILILSTSNRFYINEFPSLNTIDKVTIKSPYNDNTSGNGCWSFDGKKILMCATNSKTLHSVLRVYDSDDFSKYTDFLNEKYYLTDIHSVKSLKKYFLLGYEKGGLDTYIIWYDGNSFEEYLLENFDEVIMRSAFDDINNCIKIYTYDSVFKYDCYGKFIKEKNLDTGKKYKISFSKVFDDEICDKGKELKLLSEAFGFEDINFNDCMKDVVVSKELSIAYIATDFRVIAYDIVSSKIIDQIEIGFGVEKIDMISKNKIVVSTWNGVLIYELI